MVPEFRYHVHKSPRLVLMHSQTNPVHYLNKPFIFKIYIKIILLCAQVFQVVCFVQVSPQNPVSIYFLSYDNHMPNRIILPDVIILLQFNTEYKF